MEWSIEIKNISKQYGSRSVLTHLSLNVRKGSVLGLVGKNGAGKTTLIKAILGLTYINEGDIFVNNQSIKNHHYITNGVIGFLLEPSFYEYLSAEQNMLCTQMLLKKTDRREITSLLEFVGLEKVRKKKVSTFSFGMKQRLGLAQALLDSPPIIILDEPLVGMDIEGIKSFKSKIAELSKYGTTVVFSSHQISDVQDVCTDIAVLKDGGIYINKPVKELLGYTYWCKLDKELDKVDLKVIEKKHAYVKVCGDELIIKSRNSIDFGYFVDMLENYKIVDFKIEENDLRQFFEGDPL